MTFDCFTFFNELDLLEIRLNILNPKTDFFVLVESPETFSGKPKPLYYDENKDRFAPFNHKIIHIVMPLIKTDVAFERHYACYEAMEKEVIKRGGRDDFACFSDLDEIWKPKSLGKKIYNFKQLNYVYYLNNRSSEEWVGTLVSRIRNIKPGFNKRYRTDKQIFVEDGGWHFTNMGGPAAVVKKLESYDHTEYNTDDIKKKVEERMAKGEDYIGRSKDFYGRPFRFWLEETDLPQYLLGNKAKYKHLFKS